MLRKSKIVVWSILRDAETEPEKYLEYLSEEEKRRAYKFRFEKDRIMFVMGEEGF